MSACSSACVRVCVCADAFAVVVVVVVVVCASSEVQKTLPRMG